MFFIQPLIGRIITPHFGGSAQVWSVLLLFFQLTLFFGYLLSHCILRITKKKQVLIYSLLYVLGLIVFSFYSDFSFNWVTQNSPSYSILSYLFVNLFFPCLLISSVSTYFQKAYDFLNLGKAYRLYALSNLGSLICLLLFPLLLEPILDNQELLKTWKLLCAIDLVIIFIILGILYFKNDSGEIKTEKINFDQAKINQIKWILYSAFGTSLLVSVTQYTTSEIAPVPVIWIIPLMIYLISFILIYKKNGIYDHESRTSIIYLTQILIFYFIFSSSLGVGDYLVSFLIYFLALVILHGEIYLIRPNEKYLSTYYLYISLGGALGGIFSNLVLPLLLSINRDYQFSMLLFIILTFYILKKENLSIYKQKRIENLYHFSVLLLTIGGLYILYEKTLMHKHYRNFYGSISIEEYKTHKKLVHGVTTHGIELQNSTVPTSYYHPASPFSLVFNFLKSEKINIDIVNIGLGIGTIASYLENGDNLHFIELDPKIVSIAKNEFSFLKKSKGNISIDIGDGRKVLERDNSKYDLVFLDAYNSDAVPVHLLTKEAIEMYMEKLGDKGIILFHLSSRYLNLYKMCDALAKELGLLNLVILDHTNDQFSSKSIYSIMIKSVSHLDKLKARLKSEKYSDLRELKFKKINSKVWTDSYSSIFEILKFKEEI